MKIGETVNAYIIKFMGGYWGALDGYTRHISMSQLFSFKELALEQIEELGSPWKETCSVITVKIEIIALGEQK